jgi:hypothetical protein
MTWRRSTRRIVRRGLLGFLMLQVSAVASLMGVTKIRKIVRGLNVQPLPAAG